MIMRTLTLSVLLWASALSLQTSSHAAFDASQLPEYKPQTHVSGVIRNYGFGFGGLLKIWEEGFHKQQPDVTFQDVLITTDAAFPAMVTGVTDLAPDGGFSLIATSGIPTTGSMSRPTAR